MNRQGQVTINHVERKRTACPVGHLRFGEGFQLVCGHAIYIKVAGHFISSSSDVNKPIACVSLKSGADLCLKADEKVYPCNLNIEWDYA